MRVHGKDHLLPQFRLDPLPDLRVLDHRHPDRMSRHVAEAIAAVGEALCDCSVRVGRRRARTQHRLRRLEVLLVGLQHPAHLRIRRP